MSSLTPLHYAHLSCCAMQYVAETRRISRYDGADAAALAGCDSSLLRSSVVFEDPAVLPYQTGHASRFLGIGPRDGKL